MGMKDVTHERQQVSPVQSTAAGLAAFVGGAAIAGGTHYVATAKRLVDEGIDPTQRVKAMPVALRALGVSTVICTAVGAAAYFAFQQSGINAKPVADVASLHETITLAKHQRDLVAKEFQKKLYPSEVTQPQ
ncbi:hypothetical protein ABBQ32_005836 [Trebouxia sp. C0010 RCD-2024]